MNAAPPPAPEDQDPATMDPTSNEPQLPPRLAHELRRLVPREQALDAALEERVLVMARARLAPAPRRRLRRTLFSAGLLAAAAALLLLFRLARLHDPLDVDGSGRVDVLDAFAIARGLRDAPGAEPEGWDVNADGRVNQLDVERVLSRAVSLD